VPAPSRIEYFSHAAAIIVMSDTIVEGHSIQ